MAIRPDEFKVTKNYLLNNVNFDYFGQLYMSVHLNKYIIYTLFTQAVVLHELLGSGYTYKQWLQKFIQPTVDGDLVAVKGLRYMLQVPTTIVNPKSS